MATTQPIGYIATRAVQFGRVLIAVIARCAIKRLIPLQPQIGTGPVISATTSPPTCLSLVYATAFGICPPIGTQAKFSER